MAESQKQCISDPMLNVKMGIPAYGGHAIGKRMAPKEPYRHSKWADVSPLLKYISDAVAPRLYAPKGPYQASNLHLIHLHLGWGTIS